MRSTVSTMNLTINGHSPIPIRRQLTEQLRHAIEAGGVPRDQALPSIRELAGFLGVNPNTVARVIDDLKRSGYVEARRGKGVFVAPAPPARPSPHLRLAQFPSGARVGVASTTVETAHNLEHSIANANLPNISLVGVCPAEGAALGRLVRRADVIVCSTAAAERVRGLAGSTVQVLIDDRALDQRAIEMLAALLVRENGDRPTAAPAPRRLKSRPSRRRSPHRG